MQRYKRGSTKSGRGGKGGELKSRKQAIGLSKAGKGSRFAQIRSFKPFTPALSAQ